MRRVVRTIGIGASALIGSCRAPSTAPPVAADTVPVVVAAARPGGDGAGALTVTGTVRFKRETGLAFNTAGRIARIDVVEGQAVMPGQPLARLDPTGLDACRQRRRQADAAGNGCDPDR